MALVFFDLYVLEDLQALVMCKPDDFGVMGYFLLSRLRPLRPFEANIIVAIMKRTKSMGLKRVLDAVHSAWNLTLEVGNSWFGAISSVRQS